MPYNPPADSDVLTATLLLNDVWNQVIAQVTSGTRPTGTEGQVIYETDTNLYQAYDGSAWNQFVNLGAWTPWVPSLTQGGAVTYTTTHAAYWKLGRLVAANCHLSVTSAGTANSAVSLTLPVTASSSASGFGVGFVRDLSATTLVTGIGAINSTTVVQFRDTTAATNALLLGQTGAAFAAALASGDTVGCGVVFEAAA